MKQKTSAGLLMYKVVDGELKVFLGHPGGPFWRDKDVWSIPKGERDDLNEEFLETARREFFEETGIETPKEKEKYIELGTITQRNGKVVHVWAFEGDWSGLLLGKSFVEIEFPPKSGKKIKFPELDKVGFFSVERAKKMMFETQFELVERLKFKLAL